MVSAEYSSEWRDWIHILKGRVVIHKGLVLAVEPYPDRMRIMGCYGLNPVLDPP